MKPCPECGSDRLYRYKEEVESGGAYGPNLLPKATSSWFSSAKMLPVVCAACGYVRLFAAQEAIDKMESSPHWKQV